MPQTYLLLAASILTTVAAQLCFKKGVLQLGELTFSASGIGNLILHIFQSVWLLSGIFLFGISFLLWLFIISKLQLNVAYPIALSSEVSLASIIAWFLFKEYLSPFQMMGIVIIVIGIVLLLKH